MTSLSDKFKITGIVRWFIYVIAFSFAFVLLLTLFKSETYFLFYPISFLKGNNSLGHGDSWTPMIDALNYLRLHPDESVYDAMFLRGMKFQYPLSSLLIFDLPQKLMGWSYIKTSYYLDYISRFSILCTVLVSSRILTLILKQERFEKLRSSSGTETLILYVLTGLLTCMFYPLMRSYYLGQIQTLLTFFATLSILCWQCKKKTLAGILIGLICVIKPQLALLLIWGLVRRQWNMVIAATAVIAFFMLISVVWYGFGNNMEYLKVLSFLSHHGESFYANQSVNGLMNRMLFNGPNLVWDGKFPPYHPAVYTITLIFSLLFMFAGILWNYKKRNPDVIDYSIIIVCTTVASPIAWEHHYSLLLPIFILLSPFACYFFEGKKILLTLLAFGFALVSRYIEITKYFADTPLNFLQSYLFFGACIMLFFLFSISSKLNNGLKSS